MNFFKSRKKMGKVIIMILVVLFFQFGFATPVQADDQGVGGILLSPVISMVVGIGDRNC